MGVPKFYRWISERYPCLSEVIKEYQIPEFDNLYLDMNGIIHICSHPNDDDPHFRISEEDIFKDIFHYIEVLFRMIQPIKVFYMAVDGVAPRAKMNQQRGRRFRSAREAEENEKKALSKGEVLPTEARFDSNCITPGTEFMTKLDSQLQYFISSKISSDKLWQKCSIIYSGHKTPGEGEHKIMEYIRFSKSQPNYDPNTRHCLYGLDADLIVLGLTSHEPHFSLLREEVRFGGKNNSSKRTPTPEETTFHLLHLSLMREYIEYEFFELYDTLPFKYNLESVIDDWVLMGFLVGNDFIPHLPGLHINKDALPILYEKYKEVLPTLDGFLNEGGTLNLKRFEKFMSKLTEIDVENFHEFADNLKYIRSKTGRSLEDEVNERMMNLEKFDFEDEMQDDTFGSLVDCPLTAVEVRERLARLDIEPDEDFFGNDDDSEIDDEDSQFEAEFRQHKRHYYMTKMSIEDVTSDVLKDQATNYIRGLQWILHYYYNGICSWSWYYPFHYAPYISDVKDFANIDLFFEKASPFLPFEQLLAVLPPLSLKLLPKPYEKLMLSEDSPLLKFYPKDFETDLNGKQQEWEAVVLIPFINEKELLEAMKPCNELLSPGERERNTHGPMYIYKFTASNLGGYKAPNYFPDIGVNHAAVELVWRKDWDIEPFKLIKGLLPGVRMEIYFAGFPTLKHLKHSFRREKAGVRVFQQDSRGENFILETLEQPSHNIIDLLKNYLGKTTFVNWPHLVEAKVVAISSERSKYYVKSGSDGIPNHEELDFKQTKFWHTLREDLKNKYLKRWGINIGETEYILNCQLMTGRNYVAGNDGKITLEKKWCDIDQPFPLQTTVRDITVHDPGYKQYKTVQEYFEAGSKVFMLGHPFYGLMGDIIEVDPQHKGRIRVLMMQHAEPNLNPAINKWRNSSERYMTAYECAASLGISSHLFARLTGSIFLAKAQELNPFVDIDTVSNKLNIGLNLKSNKRSEEVIGFTKKSKDSKQWYYSEECVKALLDYQKFFPEMFDFLNRNPTKNDIFEDEVFPTTYKERVVELRKWLKDSSFTNAERCKWGTVFVDASLVKQIAEEVDGISKQRAKPVKMQIKPHLLYKPNPLQGSTPPDPKVKFELFDRVINVREGFSVPLGATGTIIGIQPAEKESDKSYVVFFDKPFACGLSLMGSDFPHRCYRLNWASMINLSFGQRANGVNCSTLPHENNIHNQGNHLETSASRGSTEASPHSNNANQEKNQVNAKSVQKQEVFREAVVHRPHSECSPGGSVKPRFTKVDHEPKPQTSVETNGKSRFESRELITPPKPNQLPQPTSFRENVTTQTNDNVVHQIMNENEVSLVLHGNYYENWPHIRESGLKMDHRNYIPCVSYVPPKIGSRTYEIHIYLNIKMMLSDGLRLLLLPKGQVLCSTDKDGFLPLKYFEKVIDTKDGRILYSSYPHNAHALSRQPSATTERAENYFGGKGRGNPRPPQPSQPTKLFANIWSQMQTVNPTALPVIQDARSYAPTSKRYDPGTPCNHQFSKANESVEERKEVSVNDLFRFASLTNPPRSLVPDMTSLHHTNSDITEAGSPLQHHMPDSKSKFVPRQVERKHTPRKAKLYNTNSISTNTSTTPNTAVITSKNAVLTNSTSQMKSSPKASHNFGAATANSCEIFEKEMDKKPKRNRRSRLAAKFQYSNSDTS